MKLSTHDKVEKVQGKCLTLSRTVRMAFFDLQLHIYSQAHIGRHIRDILIKLDQIQEQLDSCVTLSLLIGKIHFAGVPKQLKGEITVDEHLSDLETHVRTTLDQCSAQMADIRNTLR